MSVVMLYALVPICMCVIGVVAILALCLCKIAEIYWSK